MEVPIGIPMIALSKNTLPLGAWGTSIALVVGALVALEIVFFLVRLVIRRAPSIRLFQLLGRSKRALRALIVSTVGAECVRFVEPRMRSNFQEVANIAIIFSIAWIVIVVSGILVDLTESRFDITVSDNRRARRVHTQLRVMRRVIAVVIVVVSLLAALTSFSQGRSIATSILASAGVLGLVIGIAGLVTSVPVISDWFAYRYIYHVPLAILATGIEIIALLCFGIGLILDSVVHMERMSYELDQMARRFE